MYEKLKKIRISKGYSQSKFSKLIALEQTTYSRKERGKSLITEDEWNRISNALKVPIEEIKDENPLTKNNANCTSKDSFNGTKYVNINEKIFDVVLKYKWRIGTNR